MKIPYIKVMATCLVILSMATREATACSTIHLMNCDKTITGRTMDYDMDQHTLITTVPEGTPYAFGRTRFRFLTFNGFSQPGLPEGIAAQGINEKGLSIAYLWLNGTTYPKTLKEGRHYINALEFIPFVLGTMTRVADVIRFFDQGGDIDFLNLPQAIKTLDLLHQHFYLVDASGNTLVIEWIDGHRHMYLNKTPVLVNDPPFPKQQENWKRQLSEKNNIVNWEYNLVRKDKPDTRYELLRRLCEQSMPTTGIDSVTKAFQILKRVTYTPIRPYVTDKTTWTLYTVVNVHDKDNVKVYYNDADNAAIRLLEMKNIDWSEPKRMPIATGPKCIKMNGEINSSGKKTAQP